MSPARLTYLIRLDLSEFTEPRRVQGPFSPDLIQDLCRQTHNFFFINHDERRLRLEISEGDRRFAISADDWGLIPVFYTFQQSTLFVSSHIEIIKMFLPSIEMDEAARMDLAALGRISQSRTLLRGVRKLSSFAKLVCGEGQEVQEVRDTRKMASFFSQPANSEWLHELLIILKESMQGVLDSGLKNMALSGGCDSRLLLSLIPRKVLPELTFYNKRSNKLSAEKDNDFVISDQLARKYNLTLKSIQEPQNYEAFLIPEYTDEMVISGLYGGEFLGGFICRMLPSQIGARFQESKESLTDLFLGTLNTSRSLFYNKTSYSWASPYTNFYFTRTPFVNPRFLEHISKIQFSDLKDYQIYNKIWQHPDFREYAEIPFQSPLTDLFPFAKRPEGLDPKSTVEKEVRKKSFDEILNANVDFYMSHLKTVNLQDFFF